MDLKEHLILFVDDEPSNRIVFEQGFGKKFRVRCVDSGEAALEVLKTEEIAVLVTDQRMPGMSGEELLGRFMVSSPDTLRIVVTAYSDIDPILHAVNNGLVVRYIVKPWTRSELEEILAWAVETYELGRTNGAIQLRLLGTERLLALGLLSGAMIHDLNQPLASLVINVEELAELAPLMPALAELTAQCHNPAHRAGLQRLARELPDLTREIADRVRFMRGLVDSLRQFQRRESPARDPERADPVSVVKMAMSMCRSTEPEARVDAVYDGPADLPAVSTGPTELLQILINLIRNAQQAVAGAARRGIVVQAAHDDGGVRFAVTDEGPGMSEEVLAKAGTPFFTTRDAGTGLGIAQCRRLVGRAGGSFRIDSARGRGTTVTFTIPLAK
jgi:signal transduction histidine kinase